VQDVFNKIGSDFTLSQVIEKKIEEAIRQKKFEPGQKLPSELELGSMFGVSRTAVREALRMLSARGLINVRKGSGIFVNALSSLHASGPMSLYLELNFEKDYIMHVVQVRQIVEPDIARLAALHRNERDITALEKNLMELAACDPNDAMLEAELDLEFHSLIARASGNPIITVILQPLFNLMPKIKSLVIAHVENAKSAAVEYHRKIVDEIKLQNPEGAFEAMTQHLYIAKEHSKKLLEAINTSEAA
jgi:GntR family transcriptional repressor for pyruvate dehydrogenase complex